MLYFTVTLVNWLICWIRIPLFIAYPPGTIMDTNTAALMPPYFTESKQCLVSVGCYQENFLKKN